MPAWPRDIEPQRSSPFSMPGALAAKSQSGKGQRRSTVQVGRMWTESYPPFLATSYFGRKFIATIDDYWRSGTTFTIQHYSYLTRNGTGGPGTPLVNGANQTGTSLVTDGWTPSLTGVLLQGDIISVGGIPYVLDIRADANTNGSGQVTLVVAPPIFAGTTAPDNAAITVTGVTLNARIAVAPGLGDAGPDQFILGASIVFEEAV